MQQPIIVTGGAGFIGSNLVRLLLHHGESVLTLDALTYVEQDSRPIIKLARSPSRPRAMDFLGSIRAHPIPLRGGQLRRHN